MSRRYIGHRHQDHTHVTVVEDIRSEPLDPRLDLWNHSPTGFEWGYEGSGPAQLALAILADHLRDDDAAVKLHQPFKRRVVANLDEDHWELASEHVQAALQEIMTTDARAQKSMARTVH